MGGATLRNGKAFSRKPTGVREQASSSSCTRYANGRKRPPSRVLQRQKGANTAFKKAGVTYAPKQSERHRGLRGLKQESFKSVLAWSETKCKNYLMTLQVLGSARGRLCYACRSPLHATSAKKVLCCKNSDCTRPRGAAADYKGFVSTCYCFGVKAAADTAMHLTGKSEDYVDRVYTQGVVEVDGMKTQLKRKMFDKRTATAAAKAACKAKATKSREHFVLPMEDQVTKKGAPPAPEKVAEVLPPMK
ncbi:unnamed protein product, partial [Effrenium voratum]